AARAPPPRRGLAPARQAPTPAEHRHRRRAPAPAPRRARSHRILEGTGSDGTVQRTGGGVEMTATGQREIPAGGRRARVVVAGAGFGGLAAVRGLARAGMRTTLIDRNVYATFQPLLYEVATGGLTSSDVAYPARALSRRHRASFRHGELAGIDPAARQITLA